MRGRLALGAAVLVTAVAPSAAHAQQVTGIKADFELTRLGFNSGIDRSIDAVANRMGRRVGFAEVFAQATQQTRALDGDPVPNALTGFRWEDGDEWEDDDGQDWRPQGITGSADAYANGFAGSFKVLITSWYHRPGPDYARLTLHDTTEANAGADYRHVLLVLPAPGGRAVPLQSHAGGLAWIGNYLYVASTDRILVFRTSDLIKVRPTMRDEVRTYDYILPQAGSFVAIDNPNLRFSSLSLDRTQAQPALVTSEFKQDAGGGRIVRFKVPDSGLLGASVTSSNAWRARDVPNIQGALMRNGRFALTSSYGDGNPSYLYTGARRTTLRRTTWSRSGVEDLFLVGSNDRLYTLTEFSGSRRVFAVDASDHGL
jgi:hypothetical protein